MARKYWIVVIITPLIFILDQVTKTVVRARMAIGDSIPVVDGYFDIIHATNKGAAFGMFAGVDSPFRNVFFYVVAAVAFFIIIYMLVRLPRNEKYLSVVFALILAGIFGNILDRIRLGSVTDFLSIHVQHKVVDTVILGYHLVYPLEWPAFNIADSAITLAMIMLIIQIFIGERNPKCSCS